MAPSNKNCVFCKIVQGNSPETVLEYENDEIIIFKDIKPASDHHYLAVTKVHINNVKCLKKDDIQIINKLEKSLNELLESKGLDLNDTLFGFHWPPFISVSHLHMHAIAPVSKMSTLSKWVFKPGSMWFATTEYVKEWIMKQK